MSATNKPNYPVTPAQRLAAFFRAESTGGLVMLAAAALALLAANSGWTTQYAAFVHFPLTLETGLLHFHTTLEEAVKDMLMVAFFFVIGMELKRELCEGVLTDKRQILLPLNAALGGMLVPALLFLLITQTTAAHAVGWAIPTATDIAFALAVLLLAARNLPPALKVFLLAIAIFDDLGAILVIALFYSAGVSLLPLLAAIFVMLLLGLLNHVRVMRVAPYLLLGLLLCIALHDAGIHTTIGGVITGLALPLRDAKDPAASPLNRCLHRLHPWVSFGVLPLFAFTAAGISLQGIGIETLQHPLTLGVIVGLFFGKQIGIFGATWLLVKSKLSQLPPAVRWKQIYAVSLVAGIGFTMSLFIGSLAFEEAALRDAVKLGVLTGSLLSALGGWMMLRRAS